MGDDPRRRPRPKIDPAAPRPTYCNIRLGMEPADHARLVRRYAPHRILTTLPAV